MRADYLQADNRRYIPDTTHQVTPSEDAQLRLAPLHLVDPLVGPAVRTDILTLRDIATIAKSKYYPRNKYYFGTLGVIDRGYYEQMTLHLRILPYTKDHDIMDEKHYLGSYLFDSLVIKNYSIQDLQPMTQAYYDSVAQKFYFSIIGDEELMVLLQAPPNRSENYDPKKFVRSPIQARRWWSYLNYSQRFTEGKYFMVCIPVVQLRDELSHGVSTSLRREE